MKKIKVYENESEFIELSESSAENILCKYIISNENSEFSQFIFNNFEKDWFSNDNRKSLFEMSKIFWNKYNTIPSEKTFFEFFKNKRYVNHENELKSEYEKLSKFSINDFEESFIKNVITSFVKSRAAYFTVLNSVENLENEGFASSIISQFEKIVRIDLNEDLGVEYFENFENHCNKLIQVNERIPFGFSQLDKYTYGGLPAADTCLFLVMAQPGQGKSQFMMNVAANWVLRNKKVLVISLEMSEEMYSRRFDALFADLDPNKLKNNIPELKSRIRGVKLNIPNSQLRIKEFPTGTLTTAMLRQFIKKLKSTKNFEPDIIFVDYLNIMRPNLNGANVSLYEKCSRISEELRALSVELKIPIFSATQANRCLDVNTEVEELFKGKTKIQSLRENDFILSKDGKYNRVIKIYPKIKQQTYKIKTKFGREIICSANHEWPCKTGIKSIETGLNVGDKLFQLNIFRKILNFFKKYF
jgi:archaellum biogenesis ATPase FlaH